jgi:hypothetical protein
VRLEEECGEGMHFHIFQIHLNQCLYIVGSIYAFSRRQSMLPHCMKTIFKTHMPTRNHFACKSYSLSFIHSHCFTDTSKFHASSIAAKHRYLSVKG